MGNIQYVSTSDLSDLIDQSSDDDDGEGEGEVRPILIGKTDVPPYSGLSASADFHRMRMPNAKLSLSPKETRRIHELSKFGNGQSESSNFDCNMELFIRSVLMKMTAPDSMETALIVEANKRLLAGGTGHFPFVHFLARGVSHTLPHNKDPRRITCLEDNFLQFWNKKDIISLEDNSYDLVETVNKIKEYCNRYMCIGHHAMQYSYQNPKGQIPVWIIKPRDLLIQIDKHLLSTVTRWVEEGVSTQSLQQLAEEAVNMHNNRLKWEWDTEDNTTGDNGHPTENNVEMSSDEICCVCYEEMSLSNEVEKTCDCTMKVCRSCFEQIRIKTGTRKDITCPGCRQILIKQTVGTTNDEEIPNGLIRVAVIRHDHTDLSPSHYHVHL